MPRILNRIVHNLRALSDIEFNVREAKHWLPLARTSIVVSSAKDEKTAIAETGRLAVGLSLEVSEG